MDVAGGLELSIRDSAVGPFRFINTERHDDLWITLFKPDPPNSLRLAEHAATPASFTLLDRLTFLQLPELYSEPCWPPLPPARPAVMSGVRNSAQC